MVLLIDRFLTDVGVRSVRLRHSGAIAAHSDDLHNDFQIIWQTESRLGS